MALFLFCLQLCFVIHVLILVLIFYVCCESSPSIFILLGLHSNVSSKDHDDQTIIIGVFLIIHLPTGISLKIFQGTQTVPYWFTKIKTRLMLFYLFTFLCNLIIFATNLPLMREFKIRRDIMVSFLADV